MRLGNYVTVIQVEDTAPDKAAPGREERENIRKEAAGGDKPKVDVINYSSLEEAQKAVCFKMLAPGYLPPGYFFREAQSYPGSNQYPPPRHLSRPGLAG